MKLRTFVLSMLICFGLLQSKANTDLTQYDDVVYIKDVAGKAGDEITLSVQLNNKDGVIGYDFELYLPDGATVTKYSDSFGDSYYNATLTEVRTNSARHTFKVNQVGDHLKVLCYSTDKKKFTGNSGEVAQIKIKLSDDMKAGSYPITIKNEAISLDGSTPRIELVESTLTITAGLQGDLNSDNKVDIVDGSLLIEYLINPSKSSVTASAADIDGSGSVSLDDLKALVDIILAANKE